jgi:hypothetical protein
MIKALNRGVVVTASEREGGTQAIAQHVDQRLGSLGGYPGRRHLFLFNTWNWNMGKCTLHKELNNVIVNKALIDTVCI